MPLRAEGCYVARQAGEGEVRLRHPWSCSGTMTLSLGCRKDLKSATTRLSRRWSAEPTGLVAERRKGLAIGSAALRPGVVGAAGGRTSSFPHKHLADYPPQEDRGFAPAGRVQVHNGRGLVELWAG